MENVRYNISPCSSAEAEAFVARIDKASYLPRGEIKADAHSHYDRYSFVRDDSKVAVVYDVSAKVISITAPQAFADELLAAFGTVGRQVKRSTVPAQNAKREKQTEKPPVSASAPAGEKRAKIFVPPDVIRRGSIKSQTMIATAKGAELSTDEIFPPQRVKISSPDREVKKAPSVDAYFARTEAPAPVKRPVGRPRTPTISFGDEDDDGVKAPSGITTRSGTGLYADISSHAQPVEPVQQKPEVQAKRGRGRPRKKTADADVVLPPQQRDAAPVIEYKNGYSVRNYQPDKLTDMLKRLKADGCTVKHDGTEFGGTSQEVTTYVVTDASGSKAYIRYATNKKTVQIQGRRSELFGEIQSQLSRDADYSSALEGYVDQTDAGAAKKKVSDVENRLKKRLPTAYEYLSEQSRIDFSYGIHDFSQDSLMLSDYSVLLVPPFRGLERFIFDLQRAEDIKVKMIGQAYDKDDAGNYVLKRGYSQRIGSVIYCEVMVALYTEYFSRRNFFAHSDNSDDSRSRAIPDRAVAKRIFEGLLDTVEYNAKKLKEIGFSLDRAEGDKTQGKNSRSNWSKL